VAGTRVLIGPQLAGSLVRGHNVGASRLAPPYARVCDVIRLGPRSGSMAVAGLQPSTVHHGPLGTVGSRDNFPISLVRCNPNFHSRVVFVPHPIPPRSTLPPQIWQEIRSCDTRSFTQVVASPPVMDRYFGGSRQSPPRRSPPRNYFGSRPRVGSDADRREEQRRLEDERRRDEAWQRED
jgi:hypothetical protein